MTPHPEKPITETNLSGLGPGCMPTPADSRAELPETPTPMHSRAEMPETDFEDNPTNISGWGSKDTGPFTLPEIDPTFDQWLKGQLEASPDDPKDTDEFKYITFTELPPFTDQHKSLMRKTLTPEMFVLRYEPLHPDPSLATPEVQIYTSSRHTGKCMLASAVHGRLTLLY